MILFFKWLSRVTILLLLLWAPWYIYANYIKHEDSFPQFPSDREIREIVKEFEKTEEIKPAIKEPKVKEKDKRKTIKKKVAKRKVAKKKKLYKKKKYSLAKKKRWCNRKCRARNKKKLREIRRKRRKEKSWRPFKNGLEDYTW